MGEFLEFLRVWSEKIMMLMGYPGITIVMFLECVFPPIPSEVIMPLAGFLVAQGEYTFFWVLFSGTLGSLIGALALYFLGIWADEAVVRKLARKYHKWTTIGEDDVDNMMKWFTKYGQSVIFFGRMVPIVRSLISIPAGLDHMPLWKFLIYTILGSVIWNVLLTVGGYILGENWQLIIHWLDTYQNIVLVICIILFVLVVIWFIRRLRKKRAEAKAKLIAEAETTEAE